MCVVYSFPSANNSNKNSEIIQAFCCFFHLQKMKIKYAVDFDFIARWWCCGGDAGYTIYAICSRQSMCVNALGAGLFFFFGLVCCSVLLCMRNWIWKAFDFISGHIYEYRLHPVSRHPQKPTRQNIPRASETLNRTVCIFQLKCLKHLIHFVTVMALSCQNMASNANVIGIYS